MNKVIIIIMSEPWFNARALFFWVTSHSLEAKKEENYWFNIFLYECHNLSDTR